MESAVREEAEVATKTAPEKARRKKTEKKPGLILRGLEEDGGDRVLLKTDGRGNLDLQGLSPYEYRIKQDGEASDVNVDVQIFQGRIHGITFGLAPEYWSEDVARVTHLEHASIAPVKIEAEGRQFTDAAGNIWVINNEEDPLHQNDFRPLEGFVRTKEWDIVFFEARGREWELVGHYEPNNLSLPDDRFQRATRLLIEEIDHSRKNVQNVLLKPHGNDETVRNYDMSNFDPNRMDLKGSFNTIDLVIRIGIHQGTLRQNIGFCFGLTNGDLEPFDGSGTCLSNVRLKPRRMNKDGKEFRDSKQKSWKLFDEQHSRPLMARPEELLGTISPERDDLFFNENEHPETAWTLVRE